MAIYHFQSRLLPRQGKEPLLSVVSRHAGVELTDTYTQKTYGCGTVPHHRHSDILLPTGCMPFSRETLWNTVNTLPCKKNGAALVLSIIMPLELSDAENWVLGRHYLQRTFVKKGLAVDVVLRTIAVGSGKQPMLHVMVPLFLMGASGMTEQGFDCTQIGYISKCRRRWVRHVNRALKRSGYAKMQAPHPLLSPLLAAVEH